jgi:chromate transporter
MQKPTFKEALSFWIKLGFISFGGPAGQIAIMHEYLVEKKKWISESRFMHALNYCMFLPGPEAQQLAIYTGWLLHGLKGGLAAGIFFVLPSMFILLGLSVAYVALGNTVAYSLFIGLKPAVVAIVILAVIKIGKKSLNGIFHYLIAALSFISIFFFNVPFPLIILVAVLLAVVVLYFFPAAYTQSNKAAGAKAVNESDYYINAGTINRDAKFNWLVFTRQVVTAAALWLVPFVAFYFLSSHFNFWEKLSVFFTKAALVTFGGAYAVLPYVAQVSVEKFHWLTNLQMVDGLALGETTPGPLIMVLAFVGFMAGYNQYQSLAMGAVGLLVTTFYTFLPGFLFVLAGAPIIERTQDNEKLKQVFNVITAAVVGVVFNLALYLGKAVVFTGNGIGGVNYVALLWVAVSLIALYRFKVNMILWIALSAVAGMVWQYIPF